MKMTWETGSDVGVFADCTDTSGLMEIAGANTSTDDIPVVSTRNILHLFELHDIHNLLSNLPCSFHRFGMEEALHTPVIPITIVSTYSKGKYTYGLSIDCIHSKASNGHFPQQRTSLSQHHSLPFVQADDRILLGQTTLTRLSTFPQNTYIPL